VCCGGNPLYSVDLTIAKNQAVNGGGIYTTGGGFTIVGSSTIADKAATSGGGVYNDDAAGGVTELLSTLLARNGTNCVGSAVPQNAAGIQSDGTNLDTGSSCPFTSIGDQTGVTDAAVGLGQLAPNGGPPQGSSLPPAIVPASMNTMALAVASPAVDAAGTNCSSSDERGAGRPVFGRVADTCDVGAFELAPCLTLEKTCQLLVPPPFTCTKPITSLTLQWMPGSMTDSTKWVLTQPGQVIDIKAYNGKLDNKANPGAGVSLVATLCNVNPTNVVTVGGLGKNADSYWAIYSHVSTCVPGVANAKTITGKLLGESGFKTDCSDPTMKSASACGQFQGDDKKNPPTGLINDWVLQGMRSSASPDGTLDCSAPDELVGTPQPVCVVPVGGGKVQYTYMVTNIAPTAVTGVSRVDTVDNVRVAGPINIGQLNAGESQTYYSTATIVENTTNVATATGNNGQCVASDEATVNLACVLGYPYTSSNPLTSTVFSEPGVLRAFQPDFAGPNPPNDTIRLFYNDEHALTLGIRQISVKTKTGTTTPTTTTSYPVAPLSGNPASVSNPTVGPTTLTGDTSGADPVGAPMFPALFITDLTINQDLESKAGDWQFFGTPIPPHFVSGTWNAAVKTVDKTKTPNVTTVTPDADPATKNNWTLASGSDPVPAGLTNQGYGVEIRWNVNDLYVNRTAGTGSTAADPDARKLSDPFFAGHTFRMQFMVHDGDQNKAGGDVGQNCSTVTIPAP
jgi:hypothetical protein